MDGARPITGATDLSGARLGVTGARARARVPSRGRPRAAARSAHWPGSRLVVLIGSPFLGFAVQLATAPLRDRGLRIAEALRPLHQPAPWLADRARDAISGLLASSRSSPLRAPPVDTALVGPRAIFFAGDVLRTAVARSGLPALYRLTPSGTRGSRTVAHGAVRRGPSRRLVGQSRKSRTATVRRRPGRTRGYLWDTLLTQFTPTRSIRARHELGIRPRRRRRMLALKRLALGICSRSVPASGLSGTHGSRPQVPCRPR